MASQKEKIGKAARQPGREYKAIKKPTSKLLRANLDFYRMPDGVVYLPHEIGADSLRTKNLSKGAFGKEAPLAEPGQNEEISRRWVATFKFYRAHPKLLKSQKFLDWAWKSLASARKLSPKYELLTELPLDIENIWQIVHKGVSRAWYDKLLRCKSDPASKKSINFRKAQELRFRNGELDSGQIEVFEEMFGEFPARQGC